MRVACPLLLLCFLFFVMIRLDYEVGSLSVDELLCVFASLYAERSRQTSRRAEEDNSVITVPMVNRWFPPHLYRKLECVTDLGAESSEIFHESLFDTNV